MSAKKNIMLKWRGKDNTPQYFNEPGTSLRAHLNVTSRVLAILPQSGSR